MEIIYEQIAFYFDGNCLETDLFFFKLTGITLKDGDGYENESAFYKFTELFSNMKKKMETFPWQPLHNIVLNIIQGANFIPHLIL